MRYGLFVATLGLSACTVQKAETSAAKDSAVTVPVPTAAPVEAAPVAAPTHVNEPPPKPAKTPTAGGERDSAVQAVFEIGPDGKMRRAKR
jgi:hypothetical protein